MHADDSITLGLHNAPPRKRDGIIINELLGRVSCVTSHDSEAEQAAMRNANGRFDSLAA
jgi:hypothetical protein